MKGITMRTLSDYKREIRRAVRDREWLNYYGVVGCVKATREAVDMIRQLSFDMTGEEPGDMDALGVIAHHGLKALSKLQQMRIGQQEIVLPRGRSLVFTLLKGKLYADVTPFVAWD